MFMHVCMCVYVGFKEKCSVWLISRKSVLLASLGTCPHPTPLLLKSEKVGIEVTGRWAMSQRSEKHKAVSILGSQLLKTLTFWAWPWVPGKAYHRRESQYHKMGPHPRAKQGRGWDSQQCCLFAKFLSCLSAPSSLDLLQQTVGTRGKMPSHRAACTVGQETDISWSTQTPLHPTSTQHFLSPSYSTALYQLSDKIWFKFSFFPTNLFSSLPPCISNLLNSFNYVQSN